jgi:integrase
VRRLETRLLFPRADGRQPIDLRAAWARALQQAGITDFRFHDLRHSAASYLAMNGASLVDIAAILGHRTLQMVQRYAHLAEGHTAAVVARMNATIFP